MIDRASPLICPSCPSATLEGLALEGETLEMALRPLAPAPKPFHGGIVNLAWNKGCLHVYAELRDEEIYSRATANQQRLWELGDVFEVFLRDLDEKRYYEFHVAPTGHTLQLRFPARRRSGAPVEEYMVEGRLFESSVQILDGFWQVALRIPWPNGRKRLAGRRALVSFSRYDHRPSGDPVLSSTSLHRERNFHRQEEWTPIVFGA